MNDPEIQEQGECLKSNLQQLAQEAESLYKQLGATLQQDSFERVSKSVLLGMVEAATSGAGVLLRAAIPLSGAAAMILTQFSKENNKEGQDYASKMAVLTLVTLVDDVAGICNKKNEKEDKNDNAVGEPQAGEG